LPCVEAAEPEEVISLSSLRETSRSIIIRFFQTGSARALSEAVFVPNGTCKDGRLSATHAGTNWLWDG
jgi:hypothetical protein